VQGQLRKQPLRVVIQTTCAHCGEPLTLEVSSDMQATRITPGARPMVFSPLVDFGKLRDPSIIDAF
jgi:hypothetical protein